MSMEHIFRQWIGMHRAMTAWFHAAHHVTKGTGFGGDHVNLYGEIYTKLDEDLDGIIEKGIGLTGDETLADPVSSLSLAATLLSQQPASANQDAETIASNAFEVIKYYVTSIESTYAQFEAASMSLGLDDLLQGLANQYETYVYLLQQRSRTVSLQKENKMRLTESKLRRLIRKAINEVGVPSSSYGGNYSASSHGGGYREYARRRSYREQEMEEEYSQRDQDKEIRGLLHADLRKLYKQNPDQDLYDKATFDTEDEIERYWAILQNKY
jgi:hypothetical protein